MNRTYPMDIPLARALDLVGQRWTLLILSELLAGPQRYGELYQALYGISSNLLSMRLNDLIAKGLVARFGNNRRGAKYCLTTTGEALAPAIQSLSTWAQQHLYGGSPPGTGHQEGETDLSVHRYCPTCQCRVDW